MKFFAHFFRKFCIICVCGLCLVCCSVSVTNLVQHFSFSSEIWICPHYFFWSQIILQCGCCFCFLRSFLICIVALVFSPVFSLVICRWLLFGLSLFVLNLISIVDLYWLLQIWRRIGRPCIWVKVWPQSVGVHCGSDGLV